MQERNNNVKITYERVDAEKDTEELLLEYSNTKIYLGNPKVVLPQSRLKGPTCFFYGLNLLGRPRYGKDVPVSNNNNNVNNNNDINNNSNETKTSSERGRLIEIIVSNYRKFLTNSQATHQACNDLIHTFLDNFNEDETMLNKEIAAEYLNYLTDQENQVNLSQQEKDNKTHLIPFLEQFQQQNVYPYLTQFADFYLCNEPIQFCLKTMTELGYNAKAEYMKWCKLVLQANPATTHQVTNFPDSIFTEATFDQMLRDLPPKKAVLIANKMAQNAVLKAYNVQQSIWHPKHDIRLLSQALRTQGKCLVGGQFGKIFYTKPNADKLKEKFDATAVFGWKPDERIERDGNHVIVIVGLKREKDVGAVYYIDPDDDDCKLYKMSFNRLKQSIRNIAGEPITAATDFIPPLAVHADLDQLKYLKDFYDNLTDSVEEKIKKPGSSI